MRSYLRPISELELGSEAEMAALRNPSYIFFILSVPGNTAMIHRNHM